jgi:hypothetical protein
MLSCATKYILFLTFPLHLFFEDACILATKLRGKYLLVSLN